MALPRLTSLRALAALSVFVFHLGRWDVLDSEPVPLGYLGVGFFFVLSGFILTWSTRPGSGASGFLWRRLARVYPLHLVTALVALAVPVTAHRPEPLAVVANLTLMQAWIPLEEVAYGLNGVSWSLSNEAAFYCAFPLVLAPLARLSHARRLTVAATVLVLTAALVALIVRSSEYGVTAAYSNPALRFSDFLLGVVAALALMEGRRLRPALAVGLGGAALATVWLPLPWPLLNYTLSTLFAVVIVVAAQADLAGRGGVLTHRGAVWAGELSFAFYLVHELVLLNVPPLTDITGVPLAVVCFVVAVAASALLHHLVERPARRALLRLHRPVRRVGGRDRG